MNISDYKSDLVRLFFMGNLLLGGVNASLASDGSHELNLSGLWTVTYDKDKAAAINLPGTLTDAGLGTPCTLKPSMEKEVFLNLKAKYSYVGKATYARKVWVPKEWKKQRIILHFDRTIWTSQVKVNGQLLKETGESLSVPHEFDVTDYVTLGKENLLEITIDNSKKYDITFNELAHSYTNETQTKWNGILGKISLEVKPQSYIRHISVFPNVKQGNVHVKIEMQGAALLAKNQGRKLGKMRFAIVSPQGNEVKDTLLDVKGKVIEFDTQVKNAQLWDEFSPNVYTASAEYQDHKMMDRQKVNFGFRDLSNEQALLHINQRRMFLRGTLESCVFPLKGYPAMDEAGWKHIFEKAREYGLNHLRFHSWCPPEAAFAVADKMGFYLQIELPVWALNIGKDQSALDFLYAEADRILAAYGNHPSFCFLSLGNELQGDFKALETLLMHVKKQDPRRLYTTTTFTFEKGHGDWPELRDDYWVSQWSKKGWLRGQGVFEDQPVSFSKDYSSAIESLPVPVVTHEIGQYSVYPDISSISKYTGNLKPVNLESIKEDLQKKGRLKQAASYLSASTRFASILYKEELERAMKTPGYSGYQLLGLTDYPGQGTALVGLLDVFWDGKDAVSDTLFKQVCAPVVPLASFEKATYTNQDTFKASLQIANFSAETLKNIALKWSLKREDGSILHQGILEKQDVKVGNNQVLGNIAVPLRSICMAERLTLSLSVAHTKVANEWNIWVYPSDIAIVSGEVVVTNAIDKARLALNKGRKVLLNLPKDKINGLEGKFLPVFWSPVHFPNQPGTMGILCNPKHPALSDFPTEKHSNWQWWDLCKNATTMQLDSIENNIQILVGMMDNFYKNRNLGLVFETQVGKGKLVVSSIDMNELDARPVARQLKYSLIEYMKSPAFQPKGKMEFNLLKKVIYNPVKVEKSKKSIYDPAD